MLLTLLYHRVGTGKYCTPLPLLQKHFHYIKEHYTSLFPGETLSKNSICLTFDDAPLDFYRLVFPLLKKLHLKAVAAVPVQHIQETPAKRFKEKEISYCLWEELREMTETGLIQIASHSYSHCNLTDPDIDLHKEVVLSQEILEQKLKVKVDSFIYPYGKMNQAVHSYVKNHYTYAMRIGSALNWNWQNRKGLIYRVNADNMADFDTPFKKKARLIQAGRLLLNTALGK